MNDKKQISNEIRVRITYYRKKKGLTQNQVADAIGMARSSYSYYESKAVRFPPDFLNKVAKVLEVSPNTFNVETRTDSSFSFITLSESRSEYKDNNTSNLTKIENLLLASFRMLPDELQEKYLQSIMKECANHLD